MEVYREIHENLLPYCKKLMFYEIKVLEINANLMENNFQIKEINAKRRIITFQN